VRFKGTSINLKSSAKILKYLKGNIVRNAQKLCHKIKFKFFKDKPHKIMKSCRPLATNKSKHKLEKKHPLERAIDLKK